MHLYGTWGGLSIAASLFAWLGAVFFGVTGKDLERRADKRDAPTEPS
jgi:hypothetical protein